MATPAAVLSVLLTADTAGASSSLSNYQRQLQTTEKVSNSTAGKINTGLNPSLQATAKHAGEANQKTGLFHNTVRKLPSVADPATRSIGKLGTAVIGLGAAFVGFEAAKNAIQSTEQLGAATIKLSAITGLDTKTASSWIEVMKSRGVSTTQASMAFITLARNVRTAQDADTAHAAKIKALVDAQKAQRAALEATGASQKRLTALDVTQQAAMDKLSGPSTNKAIAAFTELGISQETLKSRNAKQILLDVAAGAAKIEDPMRRAAIVQQLFGRGAQAMVPVLKQGKVGIEELLASANRYGAFLPNNVKQLKQAVDAQHALNLASDGLKISFTEAVLPTLVKGAGAFLKFIAQMRDGKGAGGEFARTITVAFNLVKNVVTTVIDAFGGVKKTLLALGLAFVAFQAAGLVLAIAAMWEFLLVAGLIAAAAYLVITNWKPISGFFVNIANTIVSAWQSVEAAVLPIFDAIWKAWQPITTAIIAGVQSLAPVVGPALKAVGNIFHAAMDVIKADIAPVMALIRTLANFVIPLIGKAFQTAWDIIKVIMRTIGTTIQGGFQAIKGIIEVFTGIFTGDWGKAWKGIEDIVSGAVKAILGILKGAWQELYDVGKFLVGAIGSGFKAAFNFVISSITDFLNKIITVLDVVLDPIGAHIGKIGPGGSSGKGGGKGTSAGGHFARGGLVTQPGYFAGEEAPQHPEIILATNPAYHQRNVNLWVQAGKMLGMPGFAAGGSTSSLTLNGGPTASLGGLHFALGGIAQHSNMATFVLAPGFAKGGAPKPKSITTQKQSSHPNPAAMAILLAALGVIPSQSITGQINMASFQNAATVATNAGDTAGQARALTSELTLEKKWLSQDQTKLAAINRALSKRGLSRKTRGTLLQDKLALLQEIGTVESSIGSTTSSITALATSPTDSGTTGGTGADPNQALIDSNNAVAAAIAQNTTELLALKQSTDTQAQYLQSIGAIEKSQAIAALSGLISGQIGGNAFSKATGSAGSGQVARYGSANKY